MQWENAQQYAVHDLELLVRKYGNSIFRMCFVYLRDMDLAQDAMQDTFVKAVQKYPEFRYECSEKSWLTRIAMNTCKDAMRSAWFRHLYRHVSLDHLPEPAYDFDAEDDTLILEVMKLPGKYKDVILLRYYQNMSIAEITDTLCIPQGTVATRLNDAKKRLRKKLERWYFDES